MRPVLANELGQNTWEEEGRESWGRGKLEALLE